MRILINVKIDVLFCNCTITNAYVFLHLTKIYGTLHYLKSKVFGIQMSLLRMLPYSANISTFIPYGKKKYNLIYLIRS